jgi:hypothetical protein
MDVSGPNFLRGLPCGRCNKLTLCGIGDCRAGVFEWWALAEFEEVTFETHRLGDLGVGYSPLMRSV